ncbi:hypothetical protein Dsin_016061 [Dipteronia sinensis]|uniref:Ribonuclease H n=1 Tax=Dipteronia sinensis TaxID=43782 RepID=A0AAE0E5M1_9ROSI|nr:hypothetical protein Dsin_016061 [Dipteronia sinensis]
MAELKETYRKVYDELLGARVKKFSRVYSPRKQYFLMTTNIVESMNSCLLVVRKLPNTAMAEFIRDLLQRWFYNRRTNAHRTETTHRYEIHPIHFNTFKVVDKWKETTVDLDEHSCSCRQWDLDESSCSHAMAVARPRFKGVSINALASEFYTTGFLKHAYEMGVNPVPDPEYWDIPVAIWTRTVLPWKKRNLPGRPKKLMIPSTREKRKLKSCSNTFKPAKKARTCSICKKEGHNRLKCPDKPPEPTLIDLDEENAGGGILKTSVCASEFENRRSTKPERGFSLATSSFGLSQGCCRPGNCHVIIWIKLGMLQAWELVSLRIVYLQSVSYEMGKKCVYVVFKGRKTGVFTSWAECHEHVDGFPGASYQKFNSTDEAYQAISRHSVNSSHSRPEFAVIVEENVSEKSQRTSVMLFAFLFIFIFGVIVGKIV